MNLQKFIQNLPLDKKEHIVLGVIYSLIMFPLSFLFGNIGLIIGFSIGTFLVLYKELYIDWYKKQGNPEFLDFIYNEIPILVVFLINYI